MIGRPIHEKLYEYLAASEGLKNARAPSFKASLLRFEARRIASSRSNSVMVHREVPVPAVRRGLNLLEIVRVHYKKIVAVVQSRGCCGGRRNAQPAHRKVASLLCRIDVDDLVNEQSRTLHIQRK